MQITPGLVGDPADLETSNAVGEHARPLASGALLRELSATVLSGSCAGLVLGLSDVIRATSAGIGRLDVATVAALLALWLWCGQIVGVGVGLVRLLGGALRRLLPMRVARHGLVAAVVGVLALLVALNAFAGPGARRSNAAIWGPWVVLLCVGLGARVSIWIGTWLLAGREGRVTHWAKIAVTAALAVGAVLVDARAPGGYLYLHVLLLLGGLAMATQTLDSMGVPAVARYVAFGLSFLTMPALFTFPSSQNARALLTRPSWAGLQLIYYAQFKVDFDHDGHSPLFGSDDCDDADPTVYVGAPERPADGRDSDCDGLDDAPRSTLAFEPFRTPKTASAEVAERAKQYPTVVILVDALRFDRIGNPRFPNLALLARESVNFRQTYATSATTLTSVPAMSTGRVAPARDTEAIAQSLARAGRSSVFISPEVIIEHLQRVDALRGFSSREAVATDHTNCWGGGETVPTTEQITARAVQHLAAPRPPNLLWLHYFDVHQWNCLDVPGLPEFSAPARYDAVLERLDAGLEPLIARRDALNIVLLADHGEALGTRGLTYHAGFLFQELARVPFLVRVPGSAPAIVDTPVTNTAVFNTIRVLAGLEPERSADPDLFSLAGANDVGNGPGFASFESQQWSFIYGTHRLLFTPRQRLMELYDLARDSNEQHNEVEAAPELASQMLARLVQLNTERTP